MTNIQKPSVLIVDDQPNWRLLFTDILRENYEVTCAKTFPEARQALLDEDPPFHAVVVDIRLDDREPANEEGLKLIKELNKMGEYTNAVVVTGYPTVHTVKEALHELAAFEYLEKYSNDGQSFDPRHFLKIIHRAVEDAEKRRPRSYVIKGKRVLIVEQHDDQRNTLESILREANYDVNSVATTQELESNLRNGTYDLLVLNAMFLSQDYGILNVIRKHEPNLPIIVVTDAEIDEVLEAMKERKVLDVLTTRGGRLDELEFKEMVRRSFAYAATKYISSWFAGIAKTQKLVVGRFYTLVLNLQDDSEPGATSIWLSPKGEKSTSTILKLSIHAPSIKIPIGRETYWELPPRGKPLPLYIDILPLNIGRKTIVIDIEYGPAWLGRLEVEIDVIDTLSNQFQE